MAIRTWTRRALAARLRARFVAPDGAGAAGLDRLRLRSIRGVGTLNLAVLVAALCWLWLGWRPFDRPANPPAAVYALIPVIAAAIAALWTAPRFRNPAVAALTIGALGVGSTTALIVYSRHLSSYLLFFLWVGFAAIAWPRAPGILAVGLIALLTLLLLLALEGGDAAVEALVVALPCYAILYAVVRSSVEMQHALVLDNASARLAAARFAALYDFSTILARERDLDRLMAALVDGLAETFGYRYVSVFLLTDGRLRLMAQVGYVTPIAELALGEGITGLVAREGRPLLVRDGREHPNYLFAEAHFGSQASVPLRSRGRVVGVLNLEDGVGKLTEEDLRLLETLAAPVAIAIENAALLARLEEQAHRDPLTGLLNRRGIIAALKAALGDGSNAGPVSLLLVDLNGFKAVNDRYGHAAGDALLVELAGLLAASVRAAPRAAGGGGDAVGRLGGDEFLVVLPGTDEFAALGVVERLAAALDAAAFTSLAGGGDAPPPAVGYSLGLATAPEDGVDAATLLHVADGAMYRAKRRDRGRIRFLGRDRAREMAD